MRFCASLDRASRRTAFAARLAIRFGELARFALRYLPDSGRQQARRFCQRRRLEALAMTCRSKPFSTPAIAFALAPLAGSPPASAGTAPDDPRLLVRELDHLSRIDRARSREAVGAQESIDRDLLGLCDPADRIATPNGIAAPARCTRGCDVGRLRPSSPPLERPDLRLPRRRAQPGWARA